jgi:hypothetical protein
MTLNEYAQIVGRALINAHNNKDMIALTDTFREADQTLEENNIDPASRKAFWEKVEGVVNSGSLLLEKQSNSALLVLMQSIQREIAVRTGKAKK